MSKVRYYTDENVSRAVVRGLRQRGVNVTTIRDANGVFLASEHIRKVAKGSGPHSAPPRNAYYRARVMELIERVMFEFHPEIGDEIVLVATR